MHTNIFCIPLTPTAMHFYENLFTCQKRKHIQKRKQKALRVWNFTLLMLLIVFNWHHGSEGVEGLYTILQVCVGWGVGGIVAGYVVTSNFICMIICWCIIGLTVAWEWRFHWKRAHVLSCLIKICVLFNPSRGLIWLLRVYIPGLHCARELDNFQFLVRTDFNLS